MTQSVLTALRAVSDEVEAITKDRTASAGGTYKYRGIEDVLSALHPLFVKHGVVVVPSIEQADTLYRDVPKFNAKGEPTGSRAEYEARITVHYTIYGPDGDCIHASIYSTGTDSSDKCTGKAMSYAYKGLMFQLLCIPTAAAEDNEASGPEPERQAPTNPAWVKLSNRIKALDPDTKDTVLARFITLGCFKVNPDGGRVPTRTFSNAEIAEMDLDIDAAEDERPWEVDEPGQYTGQEDMDGKPIRREDLDPNHPLHAIDTMIDAFESDDLSAATPAMWTLAEYANPDEIVWWPVGRQFGFKTAAAVLNRANFVAEQKKLVPVRKLDEIDGRLAVELRINFLQEAYGARSF